MRTVLLMGLLVLAGCAAPQAPAPALARSADVGSSTSVWCTLVSTLTTTVRTVYVQISSDAPPALLSVGPDCSVKAQGG